jgi:hypothetical protein
MMKKNLLLTLVGILSALSSFGMLPIWGPTTVCVGSYIYPLADSTFRGGTWSSSNTAVATADSVGPYRGEVKGISPGTATITYTQGSTSAYTTVTVGPVPAPITGITSMCVGGSTTFADAAPGGIWSTSYSWVATIGSASGIATGVHAGVTTISYSISGCPATITDTVLSSPVVDSIQGPAPLCLGSSGTFSDKTTGGAWSSSNTSIITISPISGIATGVSLGTATISYTVTGVCGVTVGTYNALVSNTTSIGPITGLSSVMASAFIALSDPVWGGTWTSSNTSVATITTYGGVIGVSPGSVTITYTVVGCGGTSYVTFPVTVTPYDEISGTVFFPGTPFHGWLKVYLITYDPATLDLEAIDSTAMYSYGRNSIAYKFNNAPTDSFRIKAAWDTTGAIIGYSGYIPTYHNSSYYWYSANVLPHVSGTSDTGQNISMMTGIFTSGLGFISGNVTSGANKGTGSGAVAGLHVYAINAAGIMMQETTTDATGNYTFSNLPFDTYEVFPEALNYITTPCAGITLSSSSSSMNAASFVQHTISHTITPIPAKVGNVKPGNKDIFVFPNPSTGSLYIRSNLPVAEKSTVTITDLSGRELSVFRVDLVAGSDIDFPGVSRLSSGVYLISVKSASVDYQCKIEIKK